MITYLNNIETWLTNPKMIIRITQSHNKAAQVEEHYKTQGRHKVYLRSQLTPMSCFIRHVG